MSDGEPFSEVTRNGAVILLRFPGPPKWDEFDDVAEEYVITRGPDMLSGCMVWAKYRGAWHPNPHNMRPVVRVLLERCGYAFPENRAANV